MGLLLRSALSAIAIGLGTVFYLYVKNAYAYWDKRGVQSLPTIFPFGNFLQLFMQKLSAAEITQQFYQKTTGKFSGLYGFMRPIWFLRDPELIRTVLIRDFHHFQDHGVFADEKIDPLTGNLFHSSGEKWRNLRVKLSPTFTSGKLKSMFSTIVESGRPLQEYIAKRVANKETIEMREVTARYTTNVIASVAFGLDINCIDDPDTDFRKYGRRIFEPSFKNGMRNFLGFVSPSAMKFFKIREFDIELYDFMTSVVEQNLQYREEQNVIRKDFFQLLVQLRNTGTVQLDDQWETVISGEEKKALTLDEVTAQAFVFYLAGFETSATTISYCLYELAKTPNIQQKVCQEIDSVLEKHGGKVTYDSVLDMKYLEACVEETLRKYPPFPILNRECTKEYTIPDTDIIIEKGTAVLISIYALHYDETFYPEPKKFIPERFLDENKKGFLEMPYLPFGDGPRICIGLRMGKMQTKIGLISMLQKFNFELPENKRNMELKLDPRAPVLTPLGGLEFIITNRQKDIK